MYCCTEKEFSTITRNSVQDTKTCQYKIDILTPLRLCGLFRILSLCVVQYNVCLVILQFSGWSQFLRPSRVPRLLTHDEERQLSLQYVCSYCTELCLSLDRMPARLVCVPTSLACFIITVQVGTFNRQLAVAGLR